MFKKICKYIIWSFIASDVYVKTKLYESTFGSMPSYDDIRKWKYTSFKRYSDNTDWLYGVSTDDVVKAIVLSCAVVMLILLVLTSYNV